LHGAAHSVHVHEKRRAPKRRPGGRGIRYGCGDCRGIAAARAKQQAQHGSATRERRDKTMRATHDESRMVCDEDRRSVDSHAKRITFALRNVTICSGRARCHVRGAQHHTPRNITRRATSRASQHHTPRNITRFATSIKTVRGYAPARERSTTAGCPSRAARRCRRPNTTPLQSA